jgi:hypothetical protein
MRSAELRNGRAVLQDMAEPMRVHTSRWIRSLPLTQPLRACGFAHIPFAASRAAQVEFLRADVKFLFFMSPAWSSMVKLVRPVRPSPTKNQSGSQHREAPFAVVALWRDKNSKHQVPKWRANVVGGFASSKLSRRVRGLPTASRRHSPAMAGPPCATGQSGRVRPGQTKIQPKIQEDHSAELWRSCRRWKLLGSFTDEAFRNLS